MRLNHILLWGLGIGFVWTLATDSFLGFGLLFVSFWGLVIYGAVMTLDDITGAVSKPREVHHYHRITIDQNGNPVEVTEYEERH